MFFCGLFITFEINFTHSVMEITNLKALFPSIPLDNKHILIAGPCSAESREQTLDTARRLADVGIRIFRAGVWKPRTKPGCFEGRGSVALSWLADVKKELGMIVGTEVATPSHLKEALEAGLDFVWIGARTSANPFAMQEIADIFAGLPADRRDSIAVMVKNPVNADLELWIGAIERLYAAGLRRLGAIHRGFSSYGEHLYRNPPEWRIPIEFHRRLPEVPLFCDPSHIAGKRELVIPVAKRALDMNFDGLIIECHCNPENALSDAAQQLTPEELSPVCKCLEKKRTGELSTGPLDELRHKIDNIDDQLIDILAARMEVAREIGALKKKEGMSVVQRDRYNDLINRRVSLAAESGLNPEFMKRILSVIHEESVRQQIDL